MVANFTIGMEMGWSKYKTDFGRVLPFYGYFANLLTVAFQTKATHVAPHSRWRGPAAMASCVDRGITTFEKCALWKRRQ